MFPRGRFKIKVSIDDEPILKTKGNKFSEISESFDGLKKKLKGGFLK